MGEIGKAWSVKEELLHTKSSNCKRSEELMNKFFYILVSVMVFIACILGLLVAFNILPLYYIYIGSLVIGVIAIIYIRKNREKFIQTSQDKKPVTPSKSYQAITWITRLCAVISLGLAITIILDIVKPASQTDTAVVLNKKITEPKGDTTYNLFAHGKYQYNESVSKEFYEQVAIGDTLRVYLTSTFTEWKRAEIVRDNRVVYAARGGDILWMGLFSLAFVVPAISFRNPETWQKKLIFWIPSIILILLSFVFWVLLILKWTGSIEKF